MLKYSTGRGKPGWGKIEYRPVWWPNDLPWANVRSDARSEEEKQKVSEEKIPHCLLWYFYELLNLNNNCLLFSVLLIETSCYKYDYELTFLFCNISPSGFMDRSHSNDRQKLLQEPRPGGTVKLKIIIVFFLEFY